MFSVTVPDPDFFRKFGLRLFVHFGFVPSVMLTAVLAGTANRAITSLRTKHDMHPALAGAARFIACFMACAFGFLIAGYGFGAAFQSTVTVICRLPSVSDGIAATS